MALGLNYFDTAPMDGVGHSERRYGWALHGGVCDSYVLSTKVGRGLHPIEPGNAELTWSFDFSRQGVLKPFEASLERLGLDRVAEYSVPSVLRAELKQEGLIAEAAPTPDEPGSS